MRGGAGKLEGVEMFYERDVPMMRGCAALRPRIISGCERELAKLLSARQKQVERCVSELDFENLQIAHLPLILGERPDARLQQQIVAMFLNCCLLVR